MWSLAVLPLLLTETLCQSDVDYTDECPERFGFYADAVQCDRYYECKDGQIIDHYCPDGLVFDESSTQFAKCSFPFSVDCTGRPELQKPQASEQCPRKNGYFGHEDPAVCDKFYFCVDGVANPITCPNTLIFDPERGQCAFSDQVTRRGCSSEDFFQFQCPTNNVQSRHEHPRYPDPEDCQFFYICINGVSARRNGCTVGLVFNKETLACDRPASVRETDPTCARWYNDTFLESVGASGSPDRGTGGSTRVGNPVNLSPRKRVSVRRRRPNGNPVRTAPRQETGNPGRTQEVAEVQQEPPAPRSRPPSRPRGSVPLSGAARGASSAVGARRNKVRTRVRRPPAPVQPSSFERDQNTNDNIDPRGPPQFSLSSDEAIQRFRQSNRFVPQNEAGGSRSSSSNSGGRLTVLSGDQRRRPELRPQQVVEDEDDLPFSAFPAVPRSRRPPSAAASASPSRQSPRVSSPFERVEEAEGEFGAKSGSPFRQQRPSITLEPLERPTNSRGRPTASRQREPTPRRQQPVSRDSEPTPRRQQQTEEEDAFQTNFDTFGQDAISTARAASRRPQNSGGRSRLQSVPIKVRPRTELASEVDEEDEVNDFDLKRIPTARQRFRARSRGGQTE